jgi:hypothetical protein
MANMMIDATHSPLDLHAVEVRLNAYEGADPAVDDAWELLGVAQSDAKLLLAALREIRVVLAYAERTIRLVNCNACHDQMTNAAERAAAVLASVVDRSDCARHPNCGGGQHDPSCPRSHATAARRMPPKTEREAKQRARLEAGDTAAFKASLLESVPLYADTEAGRRGVGSPVMAQLVLHGIERDINNVSEGSPARPTPLWLDVNALTAQDFYDLDGLGSGHEYKAGDDAWRDLLAEMAERQRSSVASGSPENVHTLAAIVKRIVLAHPERCSGETCGVCEAGRALDKLVALALRGGSGSLPREPSEAAIEAALEAAPVWWDVHPVPPGDELEAALPTIAQARTAVAKILTAAYAVEGAAPRELRTDRMDLHDELDRRYPMIKDFKAFVRGVHEGELSKSDTDTRGVSSVDRAAPEQERTP